MKILMRLFYQTSLKLIKLINMFVWKIQINIMIKFTKIMITSRFDKKHMSVTNIILRITKY